MKCTPKGCFVPCTTDSECERSQECDNGVCRVSCECRSIENNCPRGTYCDGCYCTPGCGEDRDCGLAQNPRCLSRCKNNQCVDDCTCRNPHLQCPAIRFCPKDPKGTSADCRKPVGPVCKTCQNDVDCGCKPGDDCKYVCTRKFCLSNDDCKGLTGSTTCYNGRCSSKKVCKSDADCPAYELCENGFCANNCNNRCVKLQTGNRCFTGCDPLGDGSECPARLSCIELLPETATGSKCIGAKTRCTQDSDCSGGNQPLCGKDGYCNACPKGQVCRNIDPKDPNNLICIPAPPTVCGSLGGDLCKDGGF